PVQRPPAIAGPDRDPPPGEVRAALPPPPAAPIAVEPSFQSSPVPAREAAAEPPLADDAAGLGWQPWLAALLAVALGAAFLWWRRQSPGKLRHAADGDDIGALVAAPAGTPAPLPRVAAPAPAVSPRVTVPNKATTPARPLPRGASPVPPPASAPAATPAPAPGPPAQPIPGGIVASGLKPRIEFDLVPVRAETDAAEGAALTFEIIIVNAGGAPARDVLIEAQLINAGPRVDADVGRFFSQPAAGGERVAMIPPMGRATISTRLAVPGASLAPLVVEGRKLLVPVVAINAMYRWNGTEVRESSSFLVGRGEPDQGKLAPFRLDRGARSWSGLAARLHSNGLQR
nr:hypothetical protein [Pseudomonadota bacterium]